MDSQQWVSKMLLFASSTHRNLPNTLSNPVLRMSNYKQQQLQTRTAANNSRTKICRRYSSYDRIQCLANGPTLSVKTRDIFSLLRNYCCSSLHYFALFCFLCLMSMASFTGFYTDDNCHLEDIHASTLKGNCNLWCIVIKFAGM